MYTLFSDVPEYLHDSDLYITLKKNEEDGNSKIDIKAKIPPSEDVNSIDDYITSNGI